MSRERKAGDSRGDTATLRNPGAAVKPRELETDPLKSFERLLAGKGEYHEIGAVISRIPPAKLPELLDRLKEIMADPPNGIDPKQLREIAEAMYFHWAEADPRAAVQDALKRPVEVDQYRMVRVVFTAWLKTGGLPAYQ